MLSLGLARTIFLSSIASSDDAKIVVAPSTVKSPFILTSPFTSKVLVGEMLLIPTLIFSASIVTTSVLPCEFVVLIV